MNAGAAALGTAIVPLVTPFATGGDVDTGPIRRLVHHFLEQGADALLPTALTGEGPLLSEAESILVWETTFESAEARAPVYPAIITFTTDAAVRLALRAEALGASAILLAPLVPELYAGRSERDVIGFYQTVAGSTGLSIILFNYPSLTGVDLTAGLVEKLAAIEAVRYIKESTGDSKRVSALKRRLGDRVEVICGAPTNALESLVLGCRSWITGILNVVPRSGRQLLRAVHELSNLELARGIYFEQILPLVDVMEKTSNPTGTIKAGLKLRGLDVGDPRAPRAGFAPRGTSRARSHPRTDRRSGARARGASFENARKFSGRGTTGQRPVNVSGEYGRVHREVRAQQRQQTHATPSRRERRAKKIGSAQLFERAIDQRQYRSGLVHDLLESFGGSPQFLVSDLIETGAITLKDLKALQSPAPARRRRGGGGKAPMHEHIARVFYCFHIYLLCASGVGLAAWALTSIRHGSATTKYWIWVAASPNFVVPVGALLTLTSTAFLAWRSSRPSRTPRVVSFSGRSPQLGRLQGGAHEVRRDFPSSGGPRGSGRGTASARTACGGDRFD